MTNRELIKCLLDSQLGEIRRQRMKLIIEVPVETYKFLKEHYESPYGVWDVHDAIKNGIPYEERPHGHWESVGFVGMKYAWFRCSNCHKTTKIYMDSSNDFCCISDIRNKVVACLYCGADMRGGKE